MKKDLRVDGGLRLCLIWFGIAFVMFSLISGKQLHYLLPEFPAIALALAYGVCKFDMPDNQNLNRWLPGGFTIFIGLVLLLVPVLDVIPRPPVWLPLLNNMWGARSLLLGGG
jgi:4-amino-4-deoxy-L-arabinose transferase-like glycosyltransferase